jgi:hypothetical protein
MASLGPLFNELKKAFRANDLAQCGSLLAKLKVRRIRVFAHGRHGLSTRRRSRSYRTGCSRRRQTRMQAISQ